MTPPSSSRLARESSAAKDQSTNDTSTPDKSNESKETSRENGKHQNCSVEVKQPEHDELAFDVLSPGGDIRSGGPHSVAKITTWLKSGHISVDTYVRLSNDSGDTSSQQLWEVSAFSSAISNSHLLQVMRQHKHDCKLWLQQEVHWQQVCLQQLQQLIDDQLEFVREEQLYLDQLQRFVDDCSQIVQQEELYRLQQLFVDRSRFVPQEWLYLEHLVNRELFLQEELRRTLTLANLDESDMHRVLYRPHHMLESSSSTMEQKSRTTGTSEEFQQSIAAGLDLRSLTDREEGKMDGSHFCVDAIRQSGVDLGHCGGGIEKSGDTNVIDRKRAAS